MWVRPFHVLEVRTEGEEHELRTSIPHLFLPDTGLVLAPAASYSCHQAGLYPLKAGPK